MDHELQEQILLHIKKGLLYLHIAQNDDGSFTGYSFTENGNVKVSRTPFTTSLLTNCLSPLLKRNITTDEIQKISDASSLYLISQEEKSGTWNYWEINSEKRDSHPYPDDADDTFLALASIFTFKPEEITGARLSHIVRLLFSIEQSVGGPYNTWFCDFNKDIRWNDCDLGVNANIAFMLSTISVSLPTLNTYFENFIETMTFKSKYYHEAMLIYFIARSYTGNRREDLVQHILSLKKSDGTWGNPLYTALYISALSYLGEDLEMHTDAYTYLLNTHTEYTYEAEAVYIECIDSNGTWFHGSKELTTAFVIEALSHTQKTKIVDDFKREKEIIVKQYFQDISDTSDEFIALSKKYFDVLFLDTHMGKDILLPFYYTNALGYTTGSYEEKLFILSRAYIHGSIGYTLLDAVLDKQGDVSVLPFAIYSIRQCTTLYKEIFKEENFAYVSLVLKNTELAYSKEYSQKITLINDRLTVKSTKESIPSFEKSLGCALPALGALFVLNLHDAHTQASNMLTFFTLYLSVKQNIDDQHDIIEDISEGRITPVTNKILECLEKYYPEKTILDSVNDSSLLYSIFWKYVFPETHSDNISRIVMTRECTASMHLSDPSYFDSLINTLEKVLDKTNREKRNGEEFIINYVV